MADVPINSVSWNPPAPTDDSVYPFNHVRQTLSGHVFEVDDTLGNERIYEKHKSGTSRTIRADGTRVIVVQSDNFETIIGGNFIVVNGSANLTVKGDYNIAIEGDYNLEVNGSINTTSKGNNRVKTGGNQLNEISGDYARNITGSEKQIVGANAETTIKGNSTQKIVGEHAITCKSSIISAATTAGISAAVGVSLIGGAGPISLGGSVIDIGAVGQIRLTSATMLFTAGNLTCIIPSIQTTGSILAALNIIAGIDVRCLGGVRSLASHIHIAGRPTTGPIP